MQGEPLMQDQASRLRQWVRQYADTGSGVRGVRLVAVLGGRPGVGGTTLVLNLASAFSASGLRTVVVDADLGQADATRWCGLRGRETLADVVSAGRTLADVLQPAPDGFYLVPGIGPGEKLLADPRYSSQRILDGLRSLGGGTEMVLADLGTQLSPWTRALWRAGDCRLVVTSPEQDVLMDTYAAIKVLTRQIGLAPIQVVVNRAAGQTEAQEVYERLAGTCLRFLALPVSQAGFVPVDEKLAGGKGAEKSAGAWRLAGPAADRVKQIADHLTQVLGKQRPPSAMGSPLAGEGKTEPNQVSGSNTGLVRWEPAWAQSTAMPLQWHVQPGDWVGRVGFPVTVSPSLAEPVGENGKKV